MGKDVRQRTDTNIRKNESSGNYQVTFYTPKWASANNQKHKFTRTFGTLKEANQALRAHKKNIKDGKKITIPSKYTLNKAINDYINSRNLAETTKYGYNICIKYISTHYIYEQDVVEMKKRDIDNYIKHIKDNYEHLSNNTINHHLDLIRASLRYLQTNEDDIVVSVANKIVNLKKGKFTGQRYSYEEYKLVEEALLNCKDKRVAVAGCLGLYLGLRRGEICGLRWSNIDFNKKTIEIEQTVTYAGKTVEKGPKSEASHRTVGLIDTLVTLLLDYKKEQEATDVHVILKQNAGHDKVLVNSDLTPVRPNYISDLWKKFLEDNNLKPMRFHDLRHHFISAGYEQNIPPLVLAKMVGHSDLKMINRVYAHMKDEESLSIPEQIYNKYHE